MAVYSVTTWDSHTNETFTMNVVAEPSMQTELIDDLHRQMCKATDDNVAVWHKTSTPVYGMLGYDKFPRSGAIIYRGPRGTISTVSFCQLDA